MRTVDERAVTRQPWFWVAVTAGVLLLVFGTTWAISARNNADRDDDMTIVQQPPAQQEQQPAVVPVPVPSSPQAPAPSAPAPQGQLEAPAPHVSEPAPSGPIVKERTIIIDRTNGGKGQATNNPPPTARPKPSVKPAPVTPMFQDTTLPQKLRWDRAQWQAQTTTTVAEADRDLEEIGTATQGNHKLFVYSDATEPYDVVLVPIEGKENEYVEYRRMQ